MLDADGALDDLASGLRTRAEHLRQIADVPVRTHRDSGWTGRRADRLRERLETRRQVLHEQADELSRMAGAVDHLADEYRARVRQMRAIEGRVRGWMQAAAHQELEVLGWPLTQLPPPGDPRWTTVLARARAAGAHL